MTMTPDNSRARLAQQKRIATILSVAQLGYAHWFFGNLYEAIVKVPSRLAEMVDWRRFSAWAVPSVTTFLAL
jgi:hypothetical protein